MSHMEVKVKSKLQVLVRNSPLLIVGDNLDNDHYGIESVDLVEFM